MSNPNKLKMSVTKFRAITIPIMAIFLVLAIVVTIGTDYFTPSLDAFLGKGDRAASTPSGTSGWDSNYYTFVSSNGDQALVNSAAVAERIADEGEVLLKNDGILPLTRDTAITPVAASGEGGQTAFLGAAVSISEYPASTYAGMRPPLTWAILPLITFPPA